MSRRGRSKCRGLEAGTGLGGGTRQHVAGKPEVQGMRGGLWSKIMGARSPGNGMSRFYSKYSWTLILNVFLIKNTKSLRIFSYLENLTVIQEI